MSVFFANRNLNGDHIGVINPATREKLLAAIYELKLFGPTLNENACPRMCPQSSRLSSPRNKTGRPASKSGKRWRKPGYDGTGDPHRHIRSTHGCSDHAARSSGHSSNGSTSPTHGSLKDKMKRKKTPPAIQVEEEGSVEVYVQALNQDAECKTVNITTKTTSQQLISKVIDDSDTFTKDPNVYYIAMETGIKRKDSGLPIFKMIVLENDAHPLELQGCQPQGEAKFHLKMKSGGLVRVRVNVLCPGAAHKTVYIGCNTTTRQLVKLILRSCNSEESPDNFLIRESSANFEVDRMLDDHEYPLEIQSHWKQEDDVSFFLTRKVLKANVTETNEKQDTQTAEEHKSKERKTSAMDVLHEAIARLKHGKNQEKQSSKEVEPSHTERRETQSSIDSGYGKSDTEQQCENYMEPIEEAEGMFENEPDPEKKQRMIERLRKRRTSVDALDLHNVPAEKPPVAQRRVSQIDRFRDKFFEYKNCEIDALDLHDHDNKSKDKPTPPRQRRISQIDRFRDKFREYYHVKEPNRRASSVVVPVRQHQPRGTRSMSLFDADRLNLPARFNREDSARSSSSSGSSAQELGSVFSSTSPRDIHTTSDNSPNFTLFKILQNKELVRVTLCREHGKALGLELAQVTRTGRASDEDDADSEVVYVLHDGEGHNSVISSPVGDPSPIDNETFVPISDDRDKATHEERPNQGVAAEPSSTGVSPRPPRRKMATSQIIGTPPSMRRSRAETPDFHLRPHASLEPRPSSALAHLRQNNPAPSPGVVVVGISEGSIAEENGLLKEDDLIVEVNGRQMVNRSLDVVIACLQATDEVELVVAREKLDIQSPRSETPEPVQDSPSYHIELQALAEQVQQLVTKVTEMQEVLGQKDKTISTLKKALVKKKLKLSSKDKIVEGVQVIV